MTQEEWNKLNINDIIVHIFTDVNYYVTEIAEDERTLQHWKNKGYINYKRILKLENTHKQFESSHTWAGDWTKYNVV